MIAMLFSHPIAFVIAIAAGVGIQYGYEWTGHGIPSGTVILVVSLAAYLVAYIVLPRWPYRKRKG